MRYIGISNMKRVDGKRTKLLAMLKLQTDRQGKNNMPPSRIEGGGIKSPVRLHPTDLIRGFCIMQQTDVGSILVL